MDRTCNRETGIETENSLIWLLTINQKISRKAENSDFKIRLISCGLILLKSRKWYVFKKLQKENGCAMVIDLCCFVGVYSYRIYLCWYLIMRKLLQLWGWRINIWSSCLYQRNRLVESLTHNYAVFFFKLCIGKPKI